MLPLLDDPRLGAFEMPAFGVPEQSVRSEFMDHGPGDPTKQEDRRGSMKRRWLDEDLKSFVAGGRG